MRARNLVLVAFTLVASPSQAAVISFATGTLGDTGSSEARHGPITVHGFNDTLCRHNSGGDYGLGVCRGRGDELDVGEFLRLSLDPGWVWQAVILSSVDEPFSAYYSLDPYPVGGTVVAMGGHHGPAVIVLPRGHTGPVWLTPLFVETPFLLHKASVAQDTNPPAVPEPGTMALVGLGLLMGARRARKR